MHDINGMLAMMACRGYALTFAVLLAETVGLPFPASIALVAAGAAVASHTLLVSGIVIAGSSKVGRGSRATSIPFSVIALLIGDSLHVLPERLALLTDAQDPENGGFLLRDLELLRSHKHSFSDIAFYYRDSGFSNVTLIFGVLSTRLPFNVHQRERAEDLSRREFGNTVLGAETLVWKTQKQDDPVGPFSHTGKIAKMVGVTNLFPGACDERIEHW